MTKWTTEQEQAIHERHKSLLVAAAAGSGKTAVLVERIIQMISDEAHPVNIDELLIVTFTNAAAAEMKGRIGEAIQRQLAEHPLSAHLYQQSLLLQKAKITTLHSFCLELVRENFFRLNIDPQLKIANEVEGRLLLNEAVDETFEMYYGQEELLQSFTALMDGYGGREDESVREVVLRLFDLSRSMAQPEWWLQQLQRLSDGMDCFAQIVPYILEECAEMQRNLIAAIRLISPENGLTPYLPLLTEEYDFAAELVHMEADWDTLYQKLHTTEIFRRLPSLKKETFIEEEKQLVVSYRDQAKKIYKRIIEQYFTLTREAQEKILAEQSWVIDWLSRLTLAVSARYQTLKEERGLMDFSDMEHLCFQLLYEQEDHGALSKTPLSEALREQFVEVMVDEYQDINDLQERILQAVSKPDNLFMVGDLKQSIYGFRMANPQLFSEKYAVFPTGKDVSASCRRIDLNRNFRCRQNIVAAVNEVFCHLMTGQQGDLLYDAQAELVYGAHYPEDEDTLSKKVELCVFSKTQDASDEMAEEENALQQTAAEAEGAFIAQKIQALFAAETKVYDKHLESYRQITYRDIVILLRSPKRIAKIYVEQLKQLHIPAAADSGEGYFSAWEVQVVLALLHVVDNPLQDIPLLAVLKAPFFAFSDDLLARLRQSGFKQHFYDCLTQAPDCPEAVQFLTKLQKWRKLARQTALSTFIWQLYKDTSFYEYVGALPNGLQRQANLRALHQRAQIYEQTSLKGVFMFLRFLEQMEEKQADLEPAKIIGENENVVRIMSIHKSKGLEFPIVFVGNMGKQFHQQDLRKDFLIDKDYGIAFPGVDLTLGTKYPTLRQKLLQQKLRLDLLKEEKRILYVAMTRAREKLYFIGSCQDAEKKKTIPVSRASCFLDWLLPLPLSEALWHIEICSERDTVPKSEQTEDTMWQQYLEQEKPLPTSGRYRQMIAESLQWQYSHPEFSTINAQSSVTEMKHKFSPKQLEASEMEVFSFDRHPETVAKNQGLTSAEKGTLLHLLMSKIDLSVPQIDLAYMHRLIARLEAEQFIPAGQTEGIPLNGLVAFFQQEVGQRFLRAAPAQRYRELPFITALDCHILYPEIAPNQHNILVQGVIDCLWQEEDEQWVLVDYKSDYVPGKDYRLLLDRYAGQIGLYTYAIEKILCQKVKERYLYLTGQGVFVPLP